ncbi:MAG: DUF2029 domain-containing protein [bacterium]|nr:DUF2029 domain-containing protein [bacterium]
MAESLVGGTRRAKVLQPLCLVGILAGLGTFAASGPLPERPLPAALGLGVAAAAWGLAVVLAARGHAARMWLIVAGALAARLVALAADPQLSDDVYRYVWEGEVVGSGASPYVHAPLDPALAEVAARIPEVFAELNNPNISAAYPPLAQLVHAAVTFGAHAGHEAPGLRGVRAMRLFYGVCDLLVLALLARLLARRGRPLGLLVVWAWSPLVAVEFAGSGHFDSLAILLLVLAIERAQASRLAAGLLLAAGGLVKLLPFAGLPFVLRGRGGLRVAGTAALLVALLTALLYGPFILLGGGVDGLFDGLGQYGRRWEGGSLVFRFVDRAVRSVELPFGLEPQLTGRRIVGLGWLTCIAWAFWRRLELARAVGVAIAGFLVFSPTLHPWYVTWILPFVALRPRCAWILLGAGAFVLYAPLVGWIARGEWVEPGWVWPALAIPFFVLLVYDFVCTRHPLEPR